MSKEEIEAAFPALRAGSYRLTSAATPRYNCVAWATGDDSRWWQPLPDEPWCYWLDGVPKDFTAESYVRLFEAQGFKSCESADPEDRWEKIAIYTVNGEFSHVARQLEAGRWSGKLGEWEDIEHNMLSALEGAYYGFVSYILSRRRQESGQTTSA